MANDNLWAPWRMSYLRDLDRKAERMRADGGPPRDDDPVCFLGRYWREPEHDVQNYVVHRDAHGMVLLNRFPYANGHLLVALGDARPTLRDYTPEQRLAFWGLIEFAGELMHRTLHPQGINYGINEGAAAGAGVPEHLHAHLVPRWAGDVNFISVVGEVRVIPDALEAMATQYRAEAEAMG